MRSSIVFSATFAAVAVAFPISLEGLTNGLFRRSLESTITKRQYSCETVYTIVGDTISKVKMIGSCKGVHHMKVGQSASLLAGYSGAQAAAPSPAAPAPSPAAPAPSPAAPAPVASSPPSSFVSGNGFMDVNSFKDSVLKAHNDARAKFGNVPALTWSNSLASFAEDTLDSCEFKHSTPEQLGSVPAGENIAENSGATTPADMVTNMWVSEFKDYNFGSGDFGETTGHFTQVVWKTTTEVGCAVKTSCKDQYGGTFEYIKCDYSPPGNYLGQFQQNVLAPSS